jgi:hypothetical protein
MSAVTRQPFTAVSTSHRRSKNAFSWCQSDAARQIVNRRCLIRDNPFPPWALRLAGNAFPRITHSEGGRNREECWQNCEENCDIGEKNGAMDGQWLIR